MAGGGRRRVARAGIQLRGKVLSRRRDGRRAQAGAPAAAADLRRGRIGGGEDAHRADVRRVRHAWRSPERIASRIADLRARRERAGLPPLRFGMAAYAIVRSTEREARRELERITNVAPGSPGYGNYSDWVANTKLEQRLSLEDYSVSNRGLRAGLVGTPEQVADRVRAFAATGVDLLLLQCSPQLEEMERFASEVMPIVGGRREAAA